MRFHQLTQHFVLLGDFFFQRGDFLFQAGAFFILIIFEGGGSLLKKLKENVAEKRPPRMPRKLLPRITGISAKAIACEPKLSSANQKTSA
jgi:hypothetical protein